MADVDYNDYSRWRMETVERLDLYDEFTLEDFNRLVQGSFDKAQQKGLQNVFITFESQSEPYEDYLGDPCVVVCGYRPVTDEEQQELAHKEEIHRLAEEKGVTFYEAKQALELIKKGVVRW
jgi:hypothetical protein